MFKKILIANRGEIAVRVIRTCKEMGIKTVAVYSDADKDSLHVKIADESYCIGPAAPAQSYLNIPSIISVAEVAGVDAIHPGYGFLAEDDKFAEICAQSKIKFIGPMPETMAKMGNKSVAKQTVAKVGVPTVPGSEGTVREEEEGLKIANKIGYPVIIKASAGGGGRGMRVAHDDKEFKQFLKTASAEAEAAFGNPDVYVEKFVENPRHIEFQILADEKGNVIHLGERDCSIQRRHQKLLEEAPSTALDDRLRKKMGDAAIRTAKAAKYHSAGTIEFLLDKYNHFYFMEMNTRIQVEHPVTEMITNIDIVKEQIIIASGETLSHKQSQVNIEGHAIECRINAEDHERDFMPSPGEVAIYLPPGGPGIRVDSHVYPGYKVLPHYDSLIAKLIAWAPTREHAINKMDRALDEYAIGPIPTTIPFHHKVLAVDAFRKGDIYTDFIPKHFNGGSGK
ncbi:acetyl-CoA carboxylase biotin carboxylase subunit [Candidatus Margulisiibacteriota bacterium]